MLRLHDEASNCVTSGLNKRHSGDAACCVSTRKSTTYDNTYVQPPRSCFSSLPAHMGRTRVLRDARCRHPHGSRSRSDVHQSWPGAPAHVSSPGKFARRERAHRSCDDSRVCVWFEASDCCGRRMGDVFAFPGRDAARCVFTMRRGSPLPPGIWKRDGGDAACCKLVQISFAEMVLKEHGFSAAEPCHQPRLGIGLQPRRLFPI